MSFVNLRQGLVNNWPLGETPYGEEFNANLDIIQERQVFQIDFRRQPPTDPDYELPPDAPYIRINNTTNDIEFVHWVFDPDLNSDVEEVYRTLVPYPGIIVAVQADRSYAIFTGSEWKHLFDFRAPGAVEVSIDCDFPRAGKIIASLHVQQPMMIEGGAAESRVRPAKNQSVNMPATFLLLKNDDQFGTVTIPPQEGPITSPTFAIPTTYFEVGDRITLKAPDSLRGITGFSLTLRFQGSN